MQHEHIFVSADGSEAHFIVHYDMQRGRHSRTRRTSGFVGIKRVTFSGNQQQWVSWCKDCYCGTATTERQVFEGDTDFTSISRTEFLAGQEGDLLCACAARIIRTAGGQQDLAAVLSAAAAAAAAAAARAEAARAAAAAVGGGGRGGAAAEAADMAELPSAGSQSVLLCDETKAGAGYYVAFDPAGQLDSYGLVHEQGICSTCDRQRHYCRHVKCLKDLGCHKAAAGAGRGLPVQQLQAQISKCLDPDTGQRKLTCISRKAVPETPELQEVVLDAYRTLTGGPGLPEVCVVGDTTAECSVCGGCSWQEGGHDDALVFLQGAIVTCKFEWLRCEASAGCAGVLRVDGQEYGVLRKTLHLGFGYDLLYSLDKAMGSRCPSFWGHFKEALERDAHLAARHGAQRAEELKRQYLKRYLRAFQAAYLDFVQLMGIDYTHSFTCPHAASGDADIVVDGITVAFRSKSSCIMSACAPAPGSKLLVGSAFSSRVLVRSKPARSKLHELGLTGLAATDMHSLRQALASDQERALLPFLESCELADGGTMHVAPAAYRLLFRALGSSAPMCQIAGPAVWPLLDGVAAGGRLSMADLGHLQRHAPSLHMFLRGHQLQGQAYPEVTQALLRHILRIARACYDGGGERDPVASDVKPQARDDRVMLDRTTSSEAATWSHEESMLRTGVWCGMGVQGGREEGFQKSALGGSHVQRPLRKYLADYQSQGTQPSCTKHKEAKRKLLPGMVLGWCHQCKRCLFMSVMANAESPRTVFEVVYTLCRDAPRSIIYDNACNLLQYVLNREPEFFKNTRFAVDAMHYREHKHCGPDFDSSLYAAITNSPLAEQKNSVLRQLENVASYMSQTTFMYFMRHWLHRMQRIEMRKEEGQCFWWNK